MGIFIIPWHHAHCFKMILLEAGVFSLDWKFCRHMGDRNQYCTDVMPALAVAVLPFFMAALIVLLNPSQASIALSLVFVLMLSYTMTLIKLHKYSLKKSLKMVFFASAGWICLQQYFLDPKPFWWSSFLEHMRIQGHLIQFLLIILIYGFVFVVGMENGFVMGVSLISNILVACLPVYIFCLNQGVTGGFKGYGNIFIFLPFLLFGFLMSFLGHYYKCSKRRQVDNVP
ncbi:MAG: hypothetical protein RDV48_30685 [Candidatus Eremiobacteraeota bacterium]|nr:hypothetical protein [Candidatus Eremiobacteraeota bacterium]